MFAQNTTEEIHFKLNPGATKPERAHPDDLGYDLFSNQAITFHPGDVKLIGTGVSCKFPAFIGGLIKDRSSIASKRHLFTHAGVIDSGYRGEIKILFHNASNYIQRINIGDKIAQMVLVPVVNPSNEAIVDAFENETERGSAGFGSTGNKSKER